MFRKLEDQRVFQAENGIVLHHVMEPAELYDAGRMYARITIPPGGCISYHGHEDEMESFYVMSGFCRFDDGGVSHDAKEGDILITPHGCGHAVYNTADKALELLALIISRKQGVPGRG